MKHIFILIVGVILVMFLAPQIFGATISGTIYDYSLKKGDNIIVTIDSVPPQKYISKEGTYHFTIGFGEYLLEAKRYEDNVLRDAASEKIVIDKEGDYLVDLILFPSFEQEQKLIQDLPENFDPYEEKKTPYKVIFAVAAFLLLIIIIYYIKHAEKEVTDEQKEKLRNGKKNKKKTGKKQSKPAKDEKSQEQNQKQETQQKASLAFSAAADTNLSQGEQPLFETTQGDKYFQQITALLKEQQRVTQKEIRKQIPLSEAKISLIITEMETKGIVQKIKKGRGNIIVWKGNQNN
ncbi:hypothetical protein HYY69_00650 [Candidatus Woesearchaeota archaeon]|nr:hypothetical protein [Candidatus Woesearchaeota archaeon]